MSSALEAIITVPLFAKGLVGVYHFFGTKIAPDLPVSDRNGPELGTPSTKTRKLSANSEIRPFAASNAK